MSSHSPKPAAPPTGNHDLRHAPTKSNTRTSTRASPATTVVSPPNQGLTSPQTRARAANAAAAAAATPADPPSVPFPVPVHSGSGPPTSDSLFCPAPLSTASHPLPRIYSRRPPRRSRPSPAFVPPVFGRLPSSSSSLSSSSSSSSPTLLQSPLSVDVFLPPLQSFPPPAPPKPAYYFATTKTKSENNSASASSLSFDEIAGRQRSHYRRSPPPPPPSAPPPVPKPLSRSATLASLAPSLARSLPRSLLPRSRAPPANSNMVSAGRVVCVALPFVLAVVSLVALLVAGLAGVTNKSMYLLEVNTTGLSISTDSIVSLIGGRSADLVGRSVGYHDPSLLNGNKGTASSDSSSSTNITAADLNLGRLYDVALWNYCVTPQSGPRTCSKAAFNWAAKAINASETSTQALIGSTTGKTVTLPKDVRESLKAFGALSRWTQIVYLVAFVALVVEIVLGLFTSCSRGVACLTFFVASVTVVAVVAAAAMATTMAALVVGAVDGTAKLYGVRADANTGFLIAIWIAAAAAIAASFFWMFTVCCCSPSSGSRHRDAGPSHSRHADEKFVPLVGGSRAPAAYQPLHDPQDPGYYASAAPQYGAPRYSAGPRSDLAYEPYSHARS